MLDLSKLSADITHSHQAMPLVVASDIDGTLTIDSMLHSSVVNATEVLRALGIGLILVTGRAAGYAYTLFEALGAQAVIAENGGILYLKENPGQPLFLRSDHWVPAAEQSKSAPTPQQIGQALFEELQRRGVLPAHARPTYDNLFRVTDFTFELEGIDSATLAQVKETLAQGLVLAKDIHDSINMPVTASFVYSSIHAHIMPLQQNKGTALKALARLLNIQTTQILTIGDSLNDEALFDAGTFPVSVGVANLRKYFSMLHHMPRYLTANPEGHGFIEMVRTLVETKSALAQKRQTESLAAPFQHFHPIIFIDGLCVLCNSFADFILTHDKTRNLKLAALQGNTARRLLGQATHSGPPQSLILYEGGSVLLRSAAILKILHHLGTPYRQIGALLQLIPAPLRDICYTAVARSRYGLFGKRQACRLPKPEERGQFLD